MMAKKRIAIIPARGGSQRLPRKNVLKLNGVPLISRVISTARQADLFDEIYVSSEDPEILEIAEFSGALAYLRRTELADGKTGVEEVCLDLISNIPCAEFCCIYATAVLLSPKTLIESHKIFANNTTATALMGVSEYNFHPFQALIVNQHGLAQFLHKERIGLKSQAYPSVRASNGTFYWVKTKTFLVEKTFYTSNLGVFDVPASESCDIDTPKDYERLQAMFQKE